MAQFVANRCHTPARRRREAFLACRPAPVDPALMGRAPGRCVPRQGPWQRRHGSAPYVQKQASRGSAAGSEQPFRKAPRPHRPPQQAERPRAVPGEETPVPPDARLQERTAGARDTHRDQSACTACEPDQGADLARLHAADGGELVGPVPQHDDARFENPRKLRSIVPWSAASAATTRAATGVPTWPVFRASAKACAATSDPPIGPLLPRRERAAGQTIRPGPKPRNTRRKPSRPAGETRGDPGIRVASRLKVKGQPVDQSRLIG